MQSGRVIKMCRVANLSRAGQSGTPAQSERAVHNARVARWQSCRLVQSESVVELCRLLERVLGRAGLIGRTVQSGKVLK